MDVLTYYNAASAEREGSEYTETFTGASVDPENPLKATDWQFAPQLVLFWTSRCSWRWQPAS